MYVYNYSYIATFHNFDINDNTYMYTHLNGIYIKIAAHLKGKNTISNTYAIKFLICYSYIASY